MPGGSTRTASNYEPLFGERLEEKHPTKTADVRGQQVPVGRYELLWGALEEYPSRSAESLAAAREKREAKAAEKDA